MSSIDTTKWMPFKLKELFSIETGTDLIYGLQEEGCFPVIGHKALNHGVTCWIQKLDDRTLYDHNKTLSLGDRGNFVSYVQPYDFYIGTRVKALISKYKKTNIYVLCFISTIINNESYRFNYGRNSTDKTPDLIINLPVVLNLDGSYIPDWEFMENYIKSLPYKPLTTKNINNHFQSLNISTWKEFKLSDLFVITGSKTTQLKQLEEYGAGKYPYVTTQAINNGVKDFYNFYTEDGECLTVDSAVLGYCSYHCEKFSASDHVEVLKPKFLFNKFVALFLVTIINNEQYRYSYGRKCSQIKLNSSVIKLPSILNSDGSYTPDWQFMENYIKSLPYGDRI